MEPITLTGAIAWGLTIISGAFLGSYLGAYMKKRGEQRAIDEGFKRILAQTAEAPMVTKEIENKLSNKVWTAKSSGR
jgi:hypothetical protein